MSSDKKEEKTKEKIDIEKEELDKDKKRAERKKRIKESPENVESKARVDAVLEEESSSEEEIKVTRVGYVEMKLKNWKAVYCVLIGGSFYWSKTATDPEPKGFVDLKGRTLSFDVKGIKKKYHFGILDSEGELLFVGSLSSEGELQHWKNDLDAALKKEHADAPVVVAQKKKKEGVMARAKKNVASKTASSALGKKMMKTIVNDETTALINSMKRIIKKESGNAKKAEDLEKNILKLAVKGFLLVDSKTVTVDDFLVADKPLRAAFELMVKIFNAKSRVTGEKVRDACEKVVEYLKKAEEIVTNLLASHLTSKNMLRLASIFAVVADVEFLVKVYGDDELESDFEKLVDAMEYYTQFHYHKS